MKFFVALVLATGISVAGGVWANARYEAQQEETTSEVRATVRSAYSDSLQSARSEAVLMAQRFDAMEEQLQVVELALERQDTTAPAIVEAYEERLAAHRQFVAQVQEGLAPVLVASGRVLEVIDTVAVDPNNRALDPVASAALDTLRLAIDSFTELEPPTDPADRLLSAIALVLRQHFTTLEIALLHARDERPALEPITTASLLPVMGDDDQEGGLRLDRDGVVIGAVLLMVGLLGILFNHVYRFALERTKAGESMPSRTEVAMRLKADPMVTISVMVSPFIFFPLLSLAQSQPITWLTVAAAFQNGFFWQAVLSEVRGREVPAASEGAGNVREGDTGSP